MSYTRENMFSYFLDNNQYKVINQYLEAVDINPISIDKMTQIESMDKSKYYLINGNEAPVKWIPNLDEIEPIPDAGGIEFAVIKNVTSTDQIDGSADLYYNTSDGKYYWQSYGVTYETTVTNVNSLSEINSFGFWSYGGYTIVVYQSEQ